MSDILEERGQAQQMVKQRQVEVLDDWLDASDNLGIYQLQTFATGLRLDYTAVRAAIETRWSNGQTYIPHGE